MLYSSRVHDVFYYSIIHVLWFFPLLIFPIEVVKVEIVKHVLFKSLISKLFPYIFANSKMKCVHEGCDLHVIMVTSDFA